MSGKTPGDRKRQHFALVTEGPLPSVLEADTARQLGAGQGRAP